MALVIHQTLIDAGKKYKKELLSMPLATMAETIFPHMTLRTGIQGVIVGGLLSTDGELRPYRTAKDATDDTKITPFEWMTYLGDCVKEIDPNAVLGTLYTELTAKNPTDMEIAKRIALEMAKIIGQKLFDNIFKAVRNAAGNSTADLFNGFSTIIAAQVTAGNLATGKKNYQDISGTALTVNNVGDVLKAAYRNIDTQLKKQMVKMFLPDSVLDLYEDWYQVEFGHAPWNTGFEQKSLVGSRGKCELVPLSNMEDQDYIIISIKANMNIGVDQMSDTEDVKIRECDNPKAVQFFMKSYFGVGFETIQKEYLNVIKFAA